LINGLEKILTLSYQLGGMCGDARFEKHFPLMKTKEGEVILIGFMEIALRYFLF
jgi:hypothetical protein